MTKIEWTNTTINPFYYLTADGKRAFTCMPVSKACENCYAMVMEKRFKGKKAGYRGYSAESVKSVEWHRDYSAIAEAKPGTRNFISSMTDVFGDWIDRQWQLDMIDACVNNPDATFQILTKWPHKMAPIIHEYLSETNLAALPANIWLGVTVETNIHQWRIDELVSILTDGPKFVSVEPILQKMQLNLYGIDWLICGGESGNRFRAPDPDWLRSLRDQCREEGVAFFFKQWGGRTSKAGGRLLDGDVWNEFPEALNG